MGAPSHTSNKNAKKAHFADDEIPVQQAPRPPTPASKKTSEQTSVSIPTPTATPASPAPTVVPEEPRVPGPGEHTITIGQDGFHDSRINGYNPATANQNPRFHRTQGFAVQNQQAPHSYGRGFPVGAPDPRVWLPSGQYYNASQPATPGLNFPPPNINHHPAQSYTQYTTTTTVPHQPNYQYPVSTANMSGGDYGLGTMPNNGQHFQPPVPDTTYGAIPHVHRPRFDPPGAQVINGQNVVPYSSSLYPSASVNQFAVPLPQMQPAPVAISQPVIVTQAPQITTGTVTAPMPVQIPVHPHPMAYRQQPMMVQAPPGPQPPPFYCNGTQLVQGVPPQGYTAQPAYGFPSNGVPGYVVPHNQFPDVMGIGKTRNEITIDQLNAAHNSNIMEPQDFKPADDDPARMYMVRQLDGHYLAMNRYTIDNLPCRWYINQYGAFYAVRLED